MSKTTGTWYKVVSLTGSVLSGLLAGAVFSRVWRAVAKADEAPEPAALDHSTREVLLAAALHGAVFGLVKGMVERLAAKGYRQVTGSDPKR